MPPLVTIEVLDRWDRVPVGEFVPLRVAIHRPADQVGAVTLGVVRYSDPGRVTVNAELMPQDATLRPGESFSLTLGVRFTRAGPAELSDFLVQVNPVGRPDVERDLVPLPAHRFRVVPLIDGHLRVQTTRICGYDDGVKLEVTVTAVGEVTWEQFELSVGPPGRVLAGVTLRREPVLRPGQRCVFELVAAGEVLEFAFAGSADGERVTGAQTVAVGAAEDRPPEHSSFTFLEPRSLTTDQVIVQSEDGGPGVAPVGGVYPVYGNKARYLVAIVPSREAAKDVELYGAAGQVEVEERPSAGRERTFLVTVVENPILTEVVRLYYDVALPGKTLRGELYLSIRPTGWKHWRIALTAGAAVTLKGLAAVTPAVLRPDHTLDDLLTDFWGVFHKQWLDLLQLSSIPVVRGVLWAADRVFWRPYQEG